MTATTVGVELGSRPLDCAVCARVTQHVAPFGAVMWACIHCETEREADTCGPQDFPSDPTPAGTETANSSVEPCSICGAPEADVKAYYTELGKTAVLLPWCYGCLVERVGLVVGAGYPLTILPIDPIIPGYHELRAQLDRIQAGGDAEYDPHAGARAEVRRLGPPRRGYRGEIYRAPMGRKPGEWA